MQNYFHEGRKKLSALPQTPTRAVGNREIYSSRFGHHETAKGPPRGRPFVDAGAGLGGRGDTLGVEIEDGLDETQTILGLQLLELDDMDLPVATCCSMSWCYHSASRELCRFVAEIRDSRVILAGIGDDAIPLRPKHAVAFNVRQQTDIHLFCDSTQLSLDHGCLLDEGQGWSGGQVPSRPAADGLALLRASEQLKHITTANDDQKAGVEIVRKALSAPARQIAINAGEDSSIFLGNILRGMKPDIHTAMANSWHDAKLSTLGDIARQHQVRVLQQLADFGLDRREALPDAYWTEGLKEGANHKQLKLIADDVMAHRFSVLADAKRISSREPDKPSRGFGYDCCSRRLYGHVRQRRH